MEHPSHVPQRKLPSLQLHNMGVPGPCVGSAWEGPPGPFFSSLDGPSKACSNLVDISLRTIPVVEYEAPRYLRCAWLIYNFRSFSLCLGTFEVAPFSTIVSVGTCYPELPDSPLFVWELLLLLHHLPLAPKPTSPSQAKPSQVKSSQSND